MRRPCLAAALALLALAALLPAVARADEKACWRSRVVRADAFAATRAGDVTFAVIDTHGGRWGRRYDEPVRGVSLIKSLLLVTYLRQSDVARRALRSDEVALLEPMVEASDNGAAGAVIGRLGEARIEATAQRAGMASFQLILPFWGLSPTTAMEQARLFRHLDSLIPRRHRAFARRLLTNIVSYQRWGIPRALPSGWRILFKGGWGYGTGKATHQTARLERKGRMLTLAVTTFGSPGTDYGAATIEGVARRLLGSRPCGT